MTWGNPPPIKIIPTQAKLITPEQIAGESEDSHQAAYFAWCGLNQSKYPELKWFHAIPNGGSRHKAEAIKMVATGLRGGVLDIFGPVPIATELGKMYAGLYIEMKRENRRKRRDGGLSEEQLEFIAFALRMGYYVDVCYNWIEARDITIKYLELKV
jgi:hypothetical protein